MTKKFYTHFSKFDNVKVNDVITSDENRDVYDELSEEFEVFLVTPRCLKYTDFFEVEVENARQYPSSEYRHVFETKSMKIVKKIEITNDILINFIDECEKSEDVDFLKRINQSDELPEEIRKKSRSTIRKIFKSWNLKSKSYLNECLRQD